MEPGDIAVPARIPLPASLPGPASSPGLGIVSRVPKAGKVPGLSRAEIDRAQFGLKVLYDCDDAEVEYAVTPSPPLKSTIFKNLGRTVSSLSMA